MPRAMLHPMKSRERALEMRLEGRTYLEIGRELRVSRQRAQQILEPPAVIRAAVVDRDGGLCRGCGLIVGKSGHIHHRGSTGLAPETYQDLANLILLCISCHRGEHLTPRVHSPKVKAPTHRIATLNDHLCPTCRAPMTCRCPRCSGAKGGSVVTPVRLKHLVKARAAKARRAKERKTP
jgi:hypothetical protein